MEGRPDLLTKIAPRYRDRRSISVNYYDGSLNDIRATMATDVAFEASIDTISTPLQAPEGLERNTQ